MTTFTIVGWLLYGLVVGIFAKWLHPGDDPPGIIPTVVIGVIGSYIGGTINWMMGKGMTPFSPSGMFMGIVGGVVCCYAWAWYRTRNQ